MTWERVALPPSPEGTLSLWWCKVREYAEEDRIEWSAPEGFQPVQILTRDLGYVRPSGAAVQVKFIDKEGSEVII